MKRAGDGNRRGKQTQYRRQPTDDPARRLPGRRQGSVADEAAATALSQHWDSQYIAGKWNRLRHVEELAHYSLIAGYLRYYRSGGSILDVGCGEGILQERLSPEDYVKYVGIDISAEAIRRAGRKTDEKALFLCVDAEDYEATEPFDVTPSDSQKIRTRLEERRCIHCFDG